LEYDGRGVSSVSSKDEGSLTGAQRAMLAGIYDVLVRSGDWPTVQYLDSLTWGSEEREGRAVYVELAELRLVRGSPSQVQDEFQAALTLRGFGAVPAAAGDLELFLGCMRYLARAAQEFSPADPTVPTSLVIASDQVALEFASRPDAGALMRVGRMVQQTPVWSGFSGPDEKGWSLTLQIARARQFAEVQTLDDYLRIEAGQGVAAKTDDAPPPAPETQSGVTPDTAAGTPSMPIYFKRSVAADLPTGEDLLGYSPLVRALQGLLNDPSTALPLAIAVTAPWGAGKSSVMQQLETALRNGDDYQEQRRWATVRFDAWKYERSERMWAALAKAVYTQPQQRMPSWERLWFRIRLEWQRRGPLGSALMMIWPLAIVGAIVLAASHIDFSSPAAIPATLAAAAVVLGLATSYAHAFTNPFKAAIERYARRPDYESHLGFTAEADHDIGVMTRLLAPDDRHGLAVFVDDLDRCSSGHLVEVVEAMNQIFNSTPEHRCAFILGLDRDIVATNINVAYERTVTKLGAPELNGLGSRFGYEFLAKLVQLSITIPEPTPAALQTLLSKITGNAIQPSVEAGGAPAPTPTETDVQRVQQDIQTSAGASLADVRQAAQVSDAPQEVVAEAVRRERSERLEDSPEVAEAERVAVALLERNPRQLKRFHNAFRLQLYVANEDPSVPFAFTQDELVALAKWVVVRLRWPDLGNAIAQDHQLLSVIEAAANDDVKKLAIEVATDARIATSNDYLRCPGVWELMRDSDHARRMSAIELKAFLRVA